MIYMALVFLLSLLIVVMLRFRPSCEFALEATDKRMYFHLNI